MKKYRTLLFIAGLAILLLSQYKVIMPFIYKVAASDLFLVDSKDQASQLPISTPLSDIAFTHCNNYIKSELGPDVTITFPEKPLNAWTLGNYQYLINAEVTITSDTAKTSTINMPVASLTITETMRKALLISKIGLSSACQD